MPTFKVSTWFISSKKLALKCGEQGCPSTFCTYNGFRKHLNTVHSYSCDEQVDTNQEADMQRHSEVEFTSDQPSTSASILQVPPVLTQNPLDRMCGSIVAHLQTSGLSESVVQTIVCSMEEVVNDVQSQAREAVLQVFSPETKESEIYKKIEHSLNKLDNPFSTLNTETKRQKYYDEKWEMVEPKEFVLERERESIRCTLLSHVLKCFKC